MSASESDSAGVNQKRKGTADPTANKRSRKRAAAEMDQTPNEILVRIFGYLERISQFRLRRTCQRWNDVLRSSRIQAVAKLDLTVLQNLEKFEDGWEQTSLHGVEHVILVESFAETLSTEPEKFLRRFAFFVKSQADGARALIMDGLKISYPVFAGIIFLDFRASLKLIIRNTHLLLVACGSHRTPSGSWTNLEWSNLAFRKPNSPKCHCLESLEITEFTSSFPKKDPYREEPGCGPAGCLLDHIVAQCAKLDGLVSKHDGCSCEYVHRKWRPTPESLQRIKGTTKIFVTLMHSDKQLALNVSLSGSLKDLEALIYQTEGIPHSMQRIFFNGKCLNPLQLTLSEAGIQENSALHLALKGYHGHHLSEHVPLYVRLSDHRTVALTYPLAVCRDASGFLARAMRKMVKEEGGIPGTRLRLRREGESVDVNLLMRCVRGTVLTVDNQ